MKKYAVDVDFVQYIIEKAVAESKRKDINSISIQSQVITVQIVKNSSVKSPLIGFGSVIDENADENDEDGEDEIIYSYKKLRKNKLFRRTRKTYSK